MSYELMVGIRGRLIGLLLVATIALASSFFAHLYLFEQWRGQHERQLHRSKILEEVLRLKGLVVDVETNFRGYLLTEQSSFLEPINLATSRLESGMARLTDLTASTPGLQLGVGVLSARLNEFVDSKKTLVAAIGTDKQEQVRLYVRGGSGRALFLTIEKAVGDFEMRVQREIPLESMTYEAWMEQARWQLLFVDSLGAILCIVLTRSVSLPTQPSRDRRARIPL
ncbi:CHASE3 domain-containing protein [Nitrospira defluvii]|nr:CHASE3 domain-containing protein [Nitrospira defluvii]